MMSKLGPKCKKCQVFTLWVGALIGGTQVFGCPECGLLYHEVPKNAETAAKKGFCFSKLFSFGGSE